MNYLDYSFWIMLSVFVSYVAFIWIRYGIQKSISDSFYRLIEDPKVPNVIGQSLFTFFCWGFAFPAIILGANFGSFLIPLAGGLICMVGVATAFKLKFEGILHTIAAIGGILLSQISIIFEFHNMYYVTILLAVYCLLIVIYKVQNKVFWIEIGSFLSICYLLGYQLYIL